MAFGFVTEITLAQCNLFDPNWFAATTCLYFLHAYTAVLTRSAMTPFASSNHSACLRSPWLVLLSPHFLQTLHTSVIPL